jgi:HEPN domain-containing protein
MPHDPVRAADTRAWLEKAALDLRSANADLGVDPPIFGDALFHCQQAIEKALKAFLAWHDQPFLKTHDLGELGTRCAGLEANLEPLLRRAAPLTEYAWKYRNPGDVPNPAPRAATEALSFAQEVVEAIAARLPQEARPRP